MTQETSTYICPRCKNPLDRAANFCGLCGADISGVWGPGAASLGTTLAVEVDQNVDTLSQLLASATIGEYDIYGELGRGGMAAVYLALDLALNRKVAIKTMLPELITRSEMVSRFKREAQTAAGLSHPHIIQIYSVKQTNQLVYFVMKYIEGRSLESVITESGKVSVSMTQVIFGQVASALSYAHKKMVVHRDIKPANIMIDEDGWSIVTDFGIAKVQEEKQQHLTATGTAIGTPHYMSPEQCHNKAVTGFADQYSLGVVVYEMLAGRKPFDGTTYAEILTQHLFEPPKDVREVRPDVPENIALAIMKMMAKDPADRFPDLDAAAAAIALPTGSDADSIRRAMVSLVKNGPRKSVRMSVPQSPIPLSNKPPDDVDTGAKTVLANGPGGATKLVGRTQMKPQQARPRPQPAQKRNVTLIAAGAAAVLLIGGGALVGWKMMSGKKAEAPASVAAVPSGQTASPAQSGAPADSQPSGTESTAGRETKTPASSTTAPTTAQVTVSNVPSGASITVDGRRQSSAQFSVKPGTHEIRVSARGFEPMTQRATVQAGERLQLAYDRRPVAASSTASTSSNTSSTPPSQTPPANQGLATLRVAIQPAANVFLDGASKGQQVRVQEEVLPGTHTLRIERDGWVTKDTSVMLTAGQTATIRIQLVARP